MREDFREKFRILGLRIAYYRKMRGMTQEQFAEAIGRSVSFVPRGAFSLPGLEGIIRTGEETI